MYLKSKLHLGYRRNRNELPLTLDILQIRGRPYQQIVYSFKSRV